MNYIRVSACPNIENPTMVLEVERDKTTSRFNAESSSQVVMGPQPLPVAQQTFAQALIGELPCVIPIREAA